MASKAALMTSDCTALRMSLKDGRVLVIASLVPYYPLSLQASDALVREAAYERSM